MRKHQIRYKNTSLPNYLVLVLMSCLPISGAIAERSSSDIRMLNITIGKVGVGDNLNQPRRYGIEYRMRSFSRYKLIPSIGYARAEDGANFLYTDLRHDFWLSNRWVFTPSFGLGTFDDSDEINLGNELEFRTGVEFSYRFYRQYRIGIALFHISNAGISNTNPGINSLVASLCIPLENSD